MKKDDIILLIAALTLAELTLLSFLAYKYYQKVAPGLQGAENVAGVIGHLFGSSSTTTTPPV